MNLSCALNKWQGDKVASRHIAASDRNEDRVYKSDLLTGVNSYDEIKQVMEKADIFTSTTSIQNKIYSKISGSVGHLP